MMLIADSGSTKTDWRLVDAQGEVHQFKTMGFNPYFVGEEEIIKELKEQLLSQLSAADVSSVHFYGAGCSSPEKSAVVQNALQACFANAKIEVEHDLLGAARALCGKEAGLVAILGTGSNSCYYDGEKMVKNVPSLGFILGDEGSGAYLGKALVTAYLNDELPENIKQNFEARGVNSHEILDAVYRQSFPNRYLAGFSKFIFQNSKEEYIQSLLVNSFSDFLEQHIMKYEQYTTLPLHCVGSVAFYYADWLKKVASEKGINIGTVLETPIAALTLYHTEQ